MRQYRLGVHFLALAMLLGGCTVMQYPLNGNAPDATDGGSNGDDDGVPDGPNGGDVPVVTLRVSNPVPQVNEQVVWTCSVVGGDAGGVAFDFQPASRRLMVNTTTGRATFIVQETDVGVAFAVTCTATNEHGTSEPSNEQMIIPTQW